MERLQLSTEHEGAHVPIVEVISLTRAEMLVLVTTRMVATTPTERGEGLAVIVDDEEGTIMDALKRTTEEWAAGHGVPMQMFDLTQYPLED